MISLQYPSNEAWAIKKDGMHKKHDPKKIWTHDGPRKKKNIYSDIAMSSCYPNKGERDP